MAGNTDRTKGQAKVAVGDLITTKDLKTGHPAREIKRVTLHLARSPGLVPCRADAVRGSQCAS